jgi:hypothetical protein
MRPEVREEYLGAREHARGDAAFELRLERFFTELRDPLVELYGEDPRFPAMWRRLLDAIAATAAGREPELRVLDHERELTDDWLQREQAVGYVTYVDRFAGTLAGVREKLPYLRELGISYLHLMPLLRSRPAPNDGGYAVTDYGAVEPALGTMDDLRALAGDLRADGVALCVDVVLNHTAREHPWAEAAMAGDPARLAFYRTFPDRTEPDRYEATLPEVFPDTAPATSPGSRNSGAGCGRRSTPTSGTWTTRTPRSSARWPRSCSGWPRRASTSCGSTRCRSCGSAWGRAARTSRRSTSSCRPSARSCGSPRPPSRSRPRRSSPRTTSSPTWARAATRARSATWPTTTRSWSCSGARWPRGACTC